jgi:hypothetical protein
MRRVFEIGGIVAGVVLIAFGIGSLVLAAQGKSTVKDSLKLEKIVGSPDMTPGCDRCRGEGGGRDRRRRAELFGRGRAGRHR